MELQTLANFGEFIGGIGVIVSLIYLAVQVRGNTSSQRSDIYARTLERLASLQRKMAEDAEFSTLFLRGLQEPRAMKASDRIRFTWICTEFFGSFEFLHYQHQVGNISGEMWERWHQTMIWWMSFPGIKDWWRSKPTPFTNSFSTYIEQLLREDFQPENPGAWDTFVAADAVPEDSTPP